MAPPTNCSHNQRAGRAWDQEEIWVWGLTWTFGFDYFYICLTTATGRTCLISGNPWTWKILKQDKVLIGSDCTTLIALWILYECSLIALWPRKMKIDCFRQTWTKRMNKQRLAPFELLLEPLIIWNTALLLQLSFVSAVLNNTSVVWCWITIFSMGIDSIVHLQFLVSHFNNLLTLMINSM